MKDNELHNPQIPRMPGDLRATRPPLLGGEGGHAVSASRPEIGPTRAEFGRSSHRSPTTVPVEPQAARMATSVERGTGGTVEDTRTSSTATPPNRGGGQAHRRRRDRGQMPAVWIATFNIRGLKSQRLSEPLKTLKIPRIMRTEKLGILALQETHETASALASLEAGIDKLWCFSNPGTSHSAGTGFVLHRDYAPKGLRKDNITHEIIVPGRADCLTMKWGDEPISILNVYAPNNEHDAAEFFDTLKIDLSRRKINIVLGDFNHVMDKSDKLPERQPPRIITRALTEMMRCLKVDDYWRIENPSTPQFTWTSAHENADGSTSQSRLDRILYNDDFKTRATAWRQHGTFGLSDHQVVAVRITEKDPPYVGPPRWKMNLEDLEDSICMEAVRRTLHKAENQIKQGKSPMHVWLNTKERIKHQIQDRQTMRRKERGRHLHALEYDRKAVMSRKDFSTNPGLQREALALEDRISSVKRAKLDRAAESSAARYASKGESVNKYWFSIGKSIKEDALIRSLREKDGSIRTDTESMARIASKHHADHQKRQPMTPERATAIENMKATTSGKRATAEAKQTLDGDFTITRVENAIRHAAAGKAPGADGIPYEFYKHWLAELKKPKEKDAPHVPDIRWILMKVWNSTKQDNDIDHRYALGQMFLMFKKNDRMEIANYRPITLLNTDYKLQTGAMASELGRHVNNMLHPDQAGFVPGRDILDHVKLAEVTAAACEIEEIDGCLVALDQEKAYDKIDHQYLWEILAAFAIPQSWIGIVKNLYKNATTTVMLNQVTPTPFRVERGVRQGDPLSCLLFDLAIEPLAESLRRSDLKGVRIPGAVERLLVRLFADDTQLYLSKSDKWTEVRKITDEWCLASTARFNQSKTEFLPLGSHEYKKAVRKFRTLQPFRIRTQELLPVGTKILKDAEPLRILGGYIGPNLDQTKIWGKVTDKIEALADKWSKRHLTLKGRKLISSFIIQSRAQYLMMTNDPPTEIIRRIDKATHKVMWAGKKRGLTKMSELYKPYNKGGWGVPSFADKVKAARLMWAKKWLAPDEVKPLWSDIVDRLIIVTAKGKPDARRTSISTQKWDEKKGHRSKLPRSIRLMIAEARIQGAKIDALDFSSETRGQAPAWLSQMTDLTPREETKAAMKQLRTYHRVQSLKDIRRITQTNSEGCKAHGRCMLALDLLTVKTKPKFNIRYRTPLDEDGERIDNLAHTHRRRERNRLDWKFGRTFTLDPNIKYSGDIRGAMRIFTEPGTENLPPAKRQMPPQEGGPEIVVYTDGSAIDNGTPKAAAGAGIWSDEEDLIKALRVDGEPQTNNRGELAAVVWALLKAPRDRQLTIKSDSTYVINGLANTHKTWEDRGWLGVENSDLWRLALQEMRRRTAATRVAKVKAHANILGNEEADRLAKEGTQLDPSDDLKIELDPVWQITGARLQSLTFKLAYESIRERAGARETAHTASLILQGIRDLLGEIHNITPDDTTIWRSIRSDAVRREITDFLWAAIHDRSPCGTMFSKWGGEWAELQYCECGAVETMRHILTECGNATWRYDLWDEASKTLVKSGFFPNGLGGRPSFEEILAAGVPVSRNKAANRIYTTIVTETAFTIWKIRNRARFDKIRPNTRLAISLWKKSIETRVRKDLGQLKLKGPKTAPDHKRDEGIALAWRRIISVQAGVIIWFPSDYG